MVEAVVFTMAYNAERTIRRTIDSILNQTCGNFEYYILDNGSKDSTTDIIMEYAKIDERLKPIRINHNDITNGGAFWSTIFTATSAQWIVWCDADDCYSSDFLENMIGFATDNSLDVAACGYDKIDGLTNESIKHRALAENLVIYGEGFTNDFIKYRGFISYMWGKLYSITFLKSKKFAGTERKNTICSDSVNLLKVFEKADRVGVYGKAMYSYYQYPHSLSHSNIANDLHSYNDLWIATKKYLEYYGPISKINEDFLYAIHLSLVEEAVNNIFAADLATDVKLGLLIEVFSDPVWAHTLTRDADPQFLNLAARQQYVDSIKFRILKLPSCNHRFVQRLLRLLTLN
jgi:glycosyltransferase involved in cell wall biosynthesis